MSIAAQCLRAAHGGEESEDAEIGFLLTADFMLSVTTFLGGFKK